MLAGLGRGQELKGHLRGAVSNGATKEEIREVLLQAAVYCGMPVAIDAFRVAQDVFSQTEADK